MRGVRVRPRPAGSGSRGGRPKSSAAARPALVPHDRTMVDYTRPHGAHRGRTRGATVIICRDALTNLGVECRFGHPSFVERYERSGTGPDRRGRRPPMTQYLLSVHSVEGEEPPSADEMRRMYADVEVFNAERRATGAWVFAGGLHPADTATVVRVSAGEVLTTDGPFAETKEQLGGFLDHRGPRPRRRLGLGGQGICRLQGAGRGAPLPGDARRRVAVWAPQRSWALSTRSGGNPVGPWQPWSASSVTSSSAEEAVQDAFVVALERWPASGVPPNPGGWIVTTARNRAIDRFRREASRHDRHVEAFRLQQGTESVEVGPVDDDQLRLIFTCCHPSLAADAQVALTLRLLGVLRPQRSPGRSLSPAMPWQHSGSSEPSARSGRRAFPTGCRRRQSCPSGCPRCWPSST